MHVKSHESRRHSAICLIFSVATIHFSFLNWSFFRQISIQNQKYNILYPMKWKEYEQWSEHTTFHILFWQIRFAIKLRMRTRNKNNHKIWSEMNKTHYFKRNWENFNFFLCAKKSTTLILICCVLVASH